MKRVLSTFLLAMLSSALFAQMQQPMPSPSAHVSQTVGFTKIAIDYSSPGVKGRTIFGDLIPYGVTWRAGANAATTINFSTGVTIGGTNLRAGSYSIFITPQESGDWTVHFNSKGNMVYAYMKNGGIDEEALVADNAASVKVPAKTLATPMERLMYMISANDNKTAHVSMGWADKMITFEVDTQVDKKMESFKGAF